MTQLVIGKVETTNSAEEFTHRVAFSWNGREGKQLLYISPDLAEDSEFVDETIRSSILEWVEGQGQ